MTTTTTSAARTLRGKVPRVLIVEDDPDTLRYIATVFRDWHWVVDESLSAEDAIRRVAGHCPDLIVSDLVMPRMDGLELLRALREQDHDCVIFFVLVTGQGTVSQAVSAIVEGADDVVLKPFTPDDLRTILVRHHFPVDVAVDGGTDPQEDSCGDPSGPDRRGGGSAPTRP